MSDISFNIIQRANSTPYKYGDLAAPLLVYPTPLAIAAADMRLSLAARCAFVDFSSPGKLTPYLGSKIEIIDSAGKKAAGYIKAAGTGENLGSERIYNWLNGGFSRRWETFTLTSPAQNNFVSLINSSGTAQAVSSVLGSLTKGELCKLVINLTRNSGVNPTLTLNAAGGVNDIYTGITVADGVNTKYSTEPEGGSNSYMEFDAADVCDVSATCSFKSVLTPSVTGVTIVSTPGGNVQSWASIEDGFNYHDTAGYTCQIEGNRHIYKCTTPGTTASSQPVFNEGAGSTTTDGTVVWTECNPAGTMYEGPLTFQPAYGDYRRRRQYVQSIAWSAGGDPFVYDRGLPSIKRRELSWSDMPAPEYARLIDFIELTRGAKFSFLFSDEDGAVHETVLLNANDIMSAPVAHGFEGRISIELLLLS